MVKRDAGAWTNVALRAEKADIAALDAIAQDHGNMSRLAVIRLAIKRYLVSEYDDEVESMLDVYAGLNVAGRAELAEYGRMLAKKEGYAFGDELPDRWADEETVLYAEQLAEKWTDNRIEDAILEAREKWEEDELPDEIEKAVLEAREKWEEEREE